MGLTTYKILEWRPELAAWAEEEEARIDAAGSRSAIKEWAAKTGSTGTFVAIPLRSFKPVSAQPSTTVKLTNR